MSTTPEPQQRGKNQVFVPCPKDIKDRILELGGRYDNGLDVFRDIYADYLGRIDKDWVASVGQKVYFKKICANVEDGIRGVINDIGSGLLPDVFHRYCRFARDAMIFKTTMKVARLRARKLNEIRIIAIEEFGGHTVTNMALAYDLWIERNKIVREQAEANLEQAKSRVLAARNISIVGSEGLEDPEDSGDTEVVVFEARKHGKRPKLGVYNDHLDSPYGLGTIHQIPDEEELYQQFLETNSRWFQQNGLEKRLARSKSPNAKKIKSIFKIIKG
jgi:hypothetical protein